MSINFKQLRPWVGATIKTPEGKIILVQKKRDVDVGITTWRLPGGRLGKKELEKIKATADSKEKMKLLQAAALREIGEETNVSATIGELTKEARKYFVKKMYFFNASTDQTDNIHPDGEEIAVAEAIDAEIILTDEFKKNVHPDFMEPIMQCAREIIREREKMREGELATLEIHKKNKI